MSAELRMAYFAHTLRSDWNNGNAHFLRGLLRALGKIDGVQVTAFEPRTEWSIDNLRTDSKGEEALQRFAAVYSDLNIALYDGTDDYDLWHQRLSGVQVVIVHEWNPPQLAARLLALRSRLGFRLLFHDTHHRASSSPGEIERFSLVRFDGIIAFGQVLQEIYEHKFGLTRVWVLHEAADASVFHPLPGVPREDTLVWIGNWGEGERSQEIQDLLLKPAESLQPRLRTTVYGVRYPEEGLRALEQAGVSYGGYLPNLAAPEVYARAKATIHVPRRQYSRAMPGIPTIRVFEALACGIPLVSGPWTDTEQLFRAGDFLWAANTTEMVSALDRLLSNPDIAQEQAERGRETVLARHTCDHRAQELLSICKEVMQ